LQPFGSVDGSEIENNAEATGANLSRNITTRFERLKKQYKRELLPLTQQRERLERENEDLKAQRSLLLEETTVLNLRNEELAQLTAQYMRRAEIAEGSVVSHTSHHILREKSSQSLDRARLQHPSQSLSSHSSTTLNDDVQETKVSRNQKADGLDAPPGTFRTQKFLKWSGKASREQLSGKEPAAMHVAPLEYGRPKSRSSREHNFQQQSGLRIGKCDHCGDKMWGSHLRCTSKQPYYLRLMITHCHHISGCHISIHPRCLHHTHLPCSQHSSVSRDDTPSQFMPLRE
jgi:Rho-type GTPase-activating protein 1/2